MDKVQVFITDWQVLFREGIHFTLSGEDDFEVVGEATSNTEALEFIENSPPGVAILNANRSNPSGIDITRRIKQNFPSVKIVLIMDNYNVEQLFAAIKSGASACLSKDMDPEELLNIVRRVAHGESPISQALLEPDIASRILNEFEAFAQINSEVGDVLATLIPAEGQVLHHIVDGNVPDEIAKSLNVTEERVSQYLDIIINKMVSNDRNREIVDTVQGNLNNVISKISRARPPGGGEEYVTREEFEAFKDEFLSKLRSAFSNLT